MKKIFLIVILIIFYSCGEKQEKVDNCTFVKKWDIRLFDIAKAPPYYGGLYVLYYQYVTHLIGAFPVETFKLGEYGESIFRHNLAVSENYIFILGTNLAENTPYDVIIERYSLDGMLLNRWKYNDLGLNYKEIENTIATDGEDNFYIVGVKDENGEYLILKYNAEGNLLLQWSSLETYKFSSMTVDQYNKFIYFLTKRKNIKKFTLDGELLEEWNIQDVLEQESVWNDIDVVGRDEAKVFVLGATEYQGVVLGFTQNGELIGKWEKCRDEDGNVKEIIDSNILAVEQWGENQYKAYIENEIYILQLNSY